METINVVFESETATKGCACDACRNIGKVIKLTPEQEWSFWRDKGVDRKCVK